MHGVLFQLFYFNSLLSLYLKSVYYKLQVIGSPLYPVSHIKKLVFIYVIIYVIIYKIGFNSTILIYTFY